MTTPGRRYRRSSSPPTLSAHAVGPPARPGVAHEGHQPGRSALPGNDADPLHVLVLSVVQHAGILTTLGLQSCSGDLTPGGKRSVDHHHEISSIDPPHRGGDGKKEP